MRNFISEHFWCIKQVNIFRDLSEADAYALAQIITFKNLKHEERISEEGVYLLKEGRIKISESSPEVDTKKVENDSVNSDSDENQETKEVLEQGELFGVVSPDEGFWNGNSDSSTFAETLTEVCIGIVTIRDFSFFLKRKPHLSLPLLRRTQIGLSNVLKTSINPLFIGYKNKKQGWHFSSHNILKRPATPDQRRTNAFSNIAFRCASSRLALLLQNLASVPDRKGIVSVPRLSTKRMSILIGSSTETIETLLKTFKQHNVIDSRRGKIQILNPWQLKKIADARMKTLSPLPEPAPTSDLGSDLDMFATLQDEGKTKPSDTISST